MTTLILHGHIFCIFANIIKTQFNRTIKVFYSDSYMEYKESTFLASLRQSGNLPHRSFPDMSLQNGHVELKHRQLFDTIRALLISDSYP